MAKDVSAGELASRAQIRGFSHLLDAAKRDYGLFVQAELGGLKVARFVLSPSDIRRLVTPGGQVQSIASWMVAEVQAPPDMTEISALWNQHVCIMGFAPGSMQAESDKVYRKGEIAFDHVVIVSEKPTMVRQGLGRIAGFGFLEGGLPRNVW